ncbi:MAG TPA: nucleotidyl transferase AbiEii/AbiGii toxin family protein [Solirubrobacterales bacterium]|nr:nucleotidyl transferase AbiEii/AbiGii toxin family protein [Solirubrobacterales bacterium]
MNLENLKMLEAAIEHLGPLREEVVFVGGATVELWITDEAAPEFRPTTDIDVIVEVTTRSQYYRFEDAIRRIGFQNDDQSRVICRFRHPESGLVLDVMPTEASILGFENRWQKAAFVHAADVSLPSGKKIRAIPPAYLLGTKLEAFATRGRNDFLGSRDFSDLVTLIDGREELLEDVASSSAPLQSYIGDQLLRLAQQRDFDRGLEGALPSGPESRGRVDRVIWPRIRQLMIAGVVND